jgi:hypothetical protein
MRDRDELEQLLAEMNNKWRRTLDYHADAYGGARDIDVDTVFDGSALIPATARQ